MAFLPRIRIAWSGKRLFRWIGVTYLVLLGVSHLVRLSQSDFNPRIDQQWVALPEMDGQKRLNESVKLSFVDSGGNLPVLVLLHGSPASSASMMSMHASLAKTGAFRVITPDLPGFGGSSRKLEDYSIASHASYVSALLDSLQIQKAHIVGYSMSGGVAAGMMHFDSSRLSSVVLLSAIGVQELELMGDYHLNHSMHALQYGMIWLLSEATPHFGWLDSAMLGLPYARNFFDSDQRPLRSYLADFEGPTLIMHGAKDPLVPFGAAKEHHRIIPQSELVTFERAGHGIPFQQADSAAAGILDFVQRAELGLAPTRSDASLERRNEAAKTFDAANLPPVEGFALFILLALIAATTLLSEDLAAIGAGLMVARGSLDFEMALLAAFVGILSGDIGLYMAGRILGARIVSLPPFSWMIDKQRLERGTAWFRKEGAKVVLASRVIPGSRFPTYVAAGVLKAPFWKFMGVFLIGTVIWTPFIVGISTLMGNQILAFWALYESYAFLVLIGMVLLLYGLFHIGIPMTNPMGRRRLRSKWYRLTH